MSLKWITLSPVFFKVSKYMSHTSVSWWLRKIIVIVHYYFIFEYRNMTIWTSTRFTRTTRASTQGHYNFKCNEVPNLDFLIEHCIVSILFVSNYLSKHYFKLPYNILAITQMYGKHSVVWCLDCFNVIKLCFGIVSNSVVNIRMTFVKKLSGQVEVHAIKLINKKSRKW